ncbi:shikimate kinase [[Clostridium] aminophilum]|uniref:shikimate kinase n=1 Tax=[Clostridium] aminophilum TaxID=1526 RepID=UPI0026ED55D2|nr:shikimate kinase [[Clostridium] aminophilum]MDD6195919.1 shikimate kinase [[Clostridium] aminophilum]
MEEKRGRNITLIGMPSAGKSSVGVVLAKRLGYRFLDVDLVIQDKTGKLLRDIIAEDGLEGFLDIENRTNAELDCDRSIIAPGGSVIYGKEAMENLRRLGIVVYLKMSYDELERRVGNVKDRGVALKEGMTLRDLYDERLPYFEKYADITVDEQGKTLGAVIEELRVMMEEKGFSLR